MSLAENQEALLRSIHLSSIATVVTSPRLPDNPIIGVNAAFERLTGYAAADVLGINCRLLAGPGSEPEASTILHNAVAGAQAAMVEILNYRRDGTPFRNAVMIAPIFAEHGELGWFIGSQMEVPATNGELRRENARQRLQALSPRQSEVLQLMANGLLNKQIAAEMGISEKTVKMHRAALLSAIDARVSADAIRLAVEAGL